jgi:hypothetical protein
MVIVEPTSSHRGFDLEYVVAPEVNERMKENTRVIVVGAAGAPLVAGYAAALNTGYPQGARSMLSLDQYSSTATKTGYPQGARSMLSLDQYSSTATKTEVAGFFWDLLSPSYWCAMCNLNSQGVRVIHITSVS